MSVHSRSNDVSLKVGVFINTYIFIETTYYKLYFFTKSIVF